MKNRTIFPILIAFLAVFMLPQTSPAPIVWNPDTGWQTEGKVPILDTPQDQIEAGKKCEEKKDWENALNNYRVTIRLWPQSPYSPQARFGEARMLEQLGLFDKAFVSYQKLIEKNPNDERFGEILKHQYEIANRFLAGERVKVWRIKTVPSMDKAVELYEQVIKNGPYSEVAPMAQLKIGEAKDKGKLYEEAVLAYQKVIDNYSKSPFVAEAYYHIGNSYYKQSSRADYDQSAAQRAALAYQDFLSRYPKHEKIKEVEATITRLQTEQAAGLWKVAQYYDRTLGDPTAALIYYNDLIGKFPTSSYAQKAKPRLEQIKRQLAGTPAAKPKETKKTEPKDEKKK